MKTYASSIRFEGLGSFIIVQVATGTREPMRFEFVVSEPFLGSTNSSLEEPQSYRQLVRYDMYRFERY